MLLLPSVSAIIPDADGRVLLQRASDDGKWYTIGGTLEPGEQPAEGLVREVLEETGLKVEPIRLTGVYMGQPVTYRNGDQIEYVAITFLCRVIGGTLKIGDDESLELKYFALDELPPLRPDAALRIRHAMSGEASAWFQPADGAI